ncbi:hypothetical protein Tco_0654178 [Tanacetum coccineum]|uniref:Uncharacterized protein n=1 Tax=Tanacetum coccineum TaxID=301880 RepID=A0ABQ4X2M8_9ASTR
MSVKGKSVVIEEIAGDFCLGKVQNIVVHGLVKVKGTKQKNYIAYALAFCDILRNIDFEFGNEGDKMKKKVSRDSVIVEEVIEDMNANIYKFVDVTPPKWVVAEICLGALLHNTFAQDTRERPLNELFEK